MEQTINKDTLNYLKKHILFKVDKKRREEIISVLRCGRRQEILSLLDKLLTSTENTLVGTAIIIAEILLKKAAEKLRLKIIKQLKHPDDWVRERAADAMKIFANKHDIESLLEGLNDKNTLVRTYLCEALGTLNDRRAILHLYELLHDRSDLVRNSALEALSNFPADLDFSILLECLRDKSPLVRLATVDSLCHKVEANKKILQPALDLLVSHLTQERDGLVKCDIFEFLYCYDRNEDALRGLFKLTESKRGIVRWRTYNTLALVANPTNRFTVLQILKNRKRREQLRTVRAYIAKIEKAILCRIVE